MKFLRKIYSSIFVTVYKNSRTINEERFVKALFYKKNGYSLNFNSPTTFLDKLNWLKTFYYDRTYNRFVDKFEVRNYVKEKIGEQYLNSIIKVYNSVEDIDLDELPDNFVLKYTHSSGHNLIVKNKNEFDWDHQLKWFKKFKKVNYYFKYREKVYDNLQPRILAETYLSDLDSENFIDYKFYCFKGEPVYMYYKKTNGGSFKHCYIKVDDWEKVIPDTNDDKYLKEEIEKPECLDEMVSIAKKLSEKFIFIRVDLYQVKKRVLFGELTFFPQGARKVYVNKLNSVWGNLIQLPN